MIFESAIKVFAPSSINFSPPNFLNIFLEKWRIYIWKSGFILIGNLACNYLTDCPKNG